MFDAVGNLLGGESFLLPLLKQCGDVAPGAVRNHDHPPRGLFQQRLGVLVPQAERRRVHRERVAHEVVQLHQRAAVHRVEDELEAQRLLLGNQVVGTDGLAGEGGGHQWSIFRSSSRTSRY